ncbi:MAG: hypothetical protein ACI9G5_002816, partial [Paracoccaceae bacterium]
CAPRAAEQHTALDTQNIKYLAYVSKQFVKGVVVGTGMGLRLACTALIKQHNAVFFGIKKTATARITAGSGATVQEKHRYAIGIAAFFHMKNVRCTDRQSLFTVGFYIGK